MKPVPAAAGAAGVDCGKIDPEAAAEAGSTAAEGECRTGSENASRPGRNCRVEAWNAMDTPSLSLLGFEIGKFLGADYVFLIFYIFSEPFFPPIFPN